MTLPKLAFAFLFCFVLLSGPCDSQAGWASVSVRLGSATDVNAPGLRPAAGAKVEIYGYKPITTNNDGIVWVWLEKAETLTVRASLDDYVTREDKLYLSPGIEPGKITIYPVVPTAGSSQQATQATAESE